MRIGTLTLFTVLASCAAGSQPATAPDETVTEPARPVVAPLEDRSISLDPVNVAQLRDEIGDAGLVMLGEQSHGDGATFQTKIELVRTLHESMGFDVLLFESDIYGCWALNERLASAESGLEAAESCIPGIWTKSAQVAPLWRYLKQETARLEVAGFDARLASKTSHNEFRGALEAAAKDNPEWAAALKAVEPELETLWKKTQAFALDAAGQAKFEALSAAAPDDLRVFVDSLVAYAKTTANLNRLLAEHGAELATKASPAELNNVRDAQMAANLLHLLEGRFVGRKVIVWAASAHIAHDLSGVKMRGMRDGYFDDAVSAGQIVKRELGDEMYSIGFVAGGGAAGLPWSDPQELSPPLPGSIEQRALAAGLSTHLIPLHGSEWTEPMLARPLGHAYAEARWSTQFDALVFHAEMKPSTMLE